MEASVEVNLFEKADKLYLEEFEGEIKSEAQYNELGEYLREVKTLHKDLEAKRKEEVEPFLSGQRQVQATYKPYLDKLDATARVINKVMTEWTLEQERIRTEEQRRLEAKARAEEERKRKELEERARKHEEAGRDAKAEMLREQAETTLIPTPQIETKVKQAEGQHIRSVWKGKVVDVKKIPHEYLLAFSEIVQSKVDKFASSTRGTIEIPGIQFYEEKSVVTKTK